MKKFTASEIRSIFIDADNNTIVKCKNLRDFSKQHNVEHTVCQGSWLIDFDDFMQKVNHQNTKKTESLPRLRSKRSARDEWNAHHRKKIKKHIIDLACESKNVFVYKHGRKNIINYDELELEIIKQLKAKGKY